MRARPYIANGIFQHIYQRSIDRNTVFQGSLDAIVFISIYKSLSIKYRVNTLAFCLMSNHIHSLCRAGQAKELVYFVRDYTSAFVLRYNEYHNRKGPLFKRSFGYAPKRENKHLRTCISYINNNPVEAHIESCMDKYVWNLFSYGTEKNPFSPKTVLSKCSRKLRRSFKELTFASRHFRPLPYKLLEYCFSDLRNEEKLQLRDYILRIYSPVDYEGIKSIFGSLEKAKLAMHSFMGSEYDIEIDV